VNGVLPVLQGGPLLIAHRGGSGLAPENTLAAFESAAVDWAADMIECDVRATRDGHCVVLHDPTLDRTTNGTGKVADYTLEELQQFDAGYRFTNDGGRTFPFRGKGIVIPAIDEVLNRVPNARFTIEVKIGTAQNGLFAAIAKHNATQRVIVAGMHDRDRTMFKDYKGAVSASTEQAKRFYAAHKLHVSRLYRLNADVFQVPEHWGGKHVVTGRLVRALKRQGIPVHVWTVNDAISMNRLLDAGVDGLVTDRPDIASQLLQSRVGRALSPIEMRSRH
jgi:glycerophosphoryl diester phosphodiesterase